LSEGFYSNTRLAVSTERRRTLLYVEHRAGLYNAPVLSFIEVVVG